MRCLAEGDQHALSAMRFGAKEVEALHSLDPSDLYRVHRLQAHCLSIQLDREVFWQLIAYLRRERQATALQRTLILAGAPFEMMKRLFGLSSRDYALSSVSPHGRATARARRGNGQPGLGRRRGALRADPLTECFGEAISTYTRAQALDDGVLIDAGAMVKEANFPWPAANTAAAWSDCVVWSDADSARRVYQDQSGWLWDVLFMAQQAVRRHPSGGEHLAFQLYRVPRDGQSREAKIATLKLIVGPGDHGEPVITILLPDED